MTVLSSTGIAGIPPPPRTGMVYPPVPKMGNTNQSVPKPQKGNIGTILMAVAKAPISSSNDAVSAGQAVYNGSKKAVGLASTVIQNSQGQFSPSEYATANKISKEAQLVGAFTKAGIDAATGNAPGATVAVYNAPGGKHVLQTIVSGEKSVANAGKSAADAVGGAVKTGLQDAGNAVASGAKKVMSAAVAPLETVAIIAVVGLLLFEGAKSAGAHAGEAAVKYGTSKIGL